MTKKKTPKKAKIEITCEDDFPCEHKKYNKRCSGGIYGLGLIGSAIYFISTATGFWSGVLGFLKSLVWPAFLIFELFKFLGA